MTRSSFCILLVLAPSIVSALPHLKDHPPRTTGGIHLPIFKQRSTQRLSRRGGNSGSIGLGDDADVTYNVLVNVGPISTPVVLDTGSSDLWVLSDACTGNCTAGVPYYPMASFQSAGLDAQLLYGDSQTGTHAFGPIGSDTAGVAGLSLPDQFFAAINDTNTSVLDTGSAGIFGLGFPINSVIFSELFKAQDPNTPDADLSIAARSTNNRMTKFPDLPSLIRPSRNLMRTRFPTLPSLITPSKPKSKVSSRQDPGGVGTIDEVLATFATNGPLISRLAATGQLSAPQMTISLQRDTVDIGGNVGLLSIGDLPAGITNDSLTWVPIRRYTVAQGGLPAPSDSPNEVYPIAWEVPIDNVFLDGVQLPTSNLSDPSITLSALIDTGNSLIRGPQDVTNQLFTEVTGTTNPHKSTYPCSTPHQLAFQIGGTMFPIDPRDFVSQAEDGELAKCEPNVVSTDPPSTGFLYSWSLGDPFLKSAIVSFYYGNLTHPSVDPPRMGFLSTVPSNANDLLTAAVASASANGGEFTATSVSAPSGVPTGVSGFGSTLPSGGSSPSTQSNSGLVPPSVATISTSASSSSSTPKKSGDRRTVEARWSLGLGVVLVLLWTVL